MPRIAGMTDSTPLWIIRDRTTQKIFAGFCTQGVEQGQPIWNLREWYASAFRYENIHDARLDAAAIETATACKWDLEFEPIIAIYHKDGSRRG